MELQESKQSNIPVLSLKGRFDAHEIGAVRDWIAKQLEHGQAKLLVDLADVNFIDSSALSILVQGLKHCREKGGDLLLCSFQPPVKVIFELTRLDKAFHIFANEQEALN
ncbi:MAG: STAS domain-containing protein [Chloroflexota bacterium]